MNTATDPIPVDAEAQLRCQLESHRAVQAFYVARKWRVRHVATRRTIANFRSTVVRLKKAIALTLLGTMAAIASASVLVPMVPDLIDLIHAKLERQEIEAQSPPQLVKVLEPDSSGASPTAPAPSLSSGEVAPSLSDSTRPDSSAENKSEALKMSLSLSSTPRSKP